MSRNKTIYWLHNVTGLNYSICRTTLKTENWNGFRALCKIKEINPDCISDFANTCSKFLNDFAEAFRPICETLCEYLTTFQEAMINEGLELMNIMEEDESNDG